MAAKTFTISSAFCSNQQFLDEYGRTFLAEITGDAIRNGSFESVESLEKAIHAYINDRNPYPAPYAWKADGAKYILHG